MPSKTMTLELSVQQYRQLIRLTFAGYWVLETEENGIAPVVEETVDKVMQRAYDAGLTQDVMYHTELGKYFCTRDMEEEVLEKVDEFIDDEFWEELTERLSERDLIRKLGELRFNSMDDNQRRVALQLLEDFYSREFESYGVDRLYVQPVLNVEGKA